MKLEASKKQYVGKVITIIVGLVFIVNLMGSLASQGTIVPDDNNVEINNQISLDTLNDNSMIISLDCNGFEFNTISTEDGEFTAMQIPGMGHTGEIGKPMLPSRLCHIAVPDTDLKLEVIDSEYSSFQVGKPSMYSTVHL